VIQVVGVLFSAGVRLALPITALLILVDFALALLSRLNAQLQLISLAFPIKILVALAMLAWMAPLFARILNQVGGQTLLATRRILGL
jgi:flagellar biosynthetic protein FliR